MKTVHGGRADNLMLLDQGNERSLREWGASILTEMATIAEKLDETQKAQDYSEALATQTARINDASLTPSGHILKDMKAEGLTFFRFAMNKALAHREHFLGRPLDENEISLFERMTAQSVSDQQIIDSKKAPNFDDFLADVNQDYEALTSKP